MSLYRLIEVILSQENPEYIFFQLDNPSYKYRIFWHIFVLTAKFILFSYKSPASLYTPCIPCQGFDTTRINNHPNIHHFFQDIATNWYKLNGNLRQQFIQTTRPVIIIDDLNQNCGSQINSFPSSSSYRDCMYSILGKMHNFTPISYWEYHRKGNAEKMRKTLISLLYLDMRISQVFINESNLIVRSTNKWSMINFGVWYETFRFAIITQIPSVQNNGFKSLLSPLDAWAWIAIILAGTGIVGLSQLHEIQNYKTGFWQRIKKFLDPLFWTLSTLLLQMDASFPATLRRTTIKFWFIAVWYFGCILVSIFYQGEIFSCLTSIVPPIVPKTMEEFKESELHVLTTSEEIYTRGSKTASILKYSIIPELASSLEKNHSLQMFLTQSNSSRLCFTNPYGLNHLPGIAKNISWSKLLCKHSILSGSNVKIAEKPTFAVLDPKSRLEQLLELVEFYGGKYVVRNQEKTPFQLLSGSVGLRNFFYPIISNALGSLEQSGILQRWTMLEGLNNNLEAMKALNEAEYVQFYGKKMAGAKQQISAEQFSVSIDTVKYIFALCILSCLVASVIFGAENAVKNYQALINAARRMTRSFCDMVELSVDKMTVL